MFTFAHKAVVAAAFPLWILRRRRCAPEGTLDS
jgi:hypothetical protein